MTINYEWIGISGLRAGSIEHQEREASVARDDAEFGMFGQ